MATRLSLLRSMAVVVRRSLCTNFGRILTTRNTLSESRWPFFGLCNYHGSPCLYKSTKSLRRLEKMLTKKKKKFYYDPMNVAQLGRLATGGSSSSGKAKMKSEDSIRLRTYNKILYDNISDMMTSSLVSDELEKLQVTVLGVRVSGDMSACRVYWASTGDAKEDDRIEEILNRHKGLLRHALISHRVLGKIPPIFFLKDKASANISEIERLLAVADFGPEEDETEVVEMQTEEETEESGVDGRMEFVQQTNRPPRGDASRVTQPSLFGIDHDELNRMISLNKNMNFGHERGLDDGDLDKQFEQFRAFMKKKKKLSKSERRQAAFYKGELEVYKSSRLEEFRDDDLAEEESGTDITETYSDQDDYEDRRDYNEYRERSDENFILSDEPKNK